MKFGISQPVRRKEDQRFLTGKGRYVDDISLPGQAHACVVRSPLACAAIESIEVSEAAAATGVLAVYTGADLEADGMGHLPCNIPLKSRDGSPRADTPRPALAVGRVRHVGDPVAVVIAETAAQARDGAELVHVEYEDMPAVADLAEAAKPGAPQVWDHAPGNVAFDWEQYDKPATDAAFAAAAHVVSMEIVNNRLVPNPIEPRSALAAYDPDDERFTIYLQTQGAHSLRRQLADVFLKVPQDKVRVITPDVGGGFGMKLFFYPEYAMVAYAARKLGRPVKWTAERGESFLSDSHARSHLTTAELALDAEGGFLALRVSTLADMGAYLSGAAPLIPTSAYVPILTGQYRIPALYAEVKGIFTNTVPVDAYRGAGRPEAMYLVERLVNRAAETLGIAPEELRRRNFVPADAMPYTTPTGLVYDSGDFAAILDGAMDRADWSGFPARREAARSRGRLAGIGMACYVEMTGGAPTEDAEIVFNDDGSVSVMVGTMSNGQGHETAFAQLVAERLGVDFEKIEVVMGDTDRIKTGGGTGGSRSLHAEGGAIVVTADMIIDKGKAIAANVLEAAVTDIEFHEGRFGVAGTDIGIDILDLARAARDPGNLPEGMEAGLDTTGRYATEGNKTYPNGCHICEVEVDPETGVTQVVRYTVVDDLGNVVNPLLVAGQVHGGIAQGLGQALMEQTVYDGNGQLLSGSYMDYCMPRADDIPAIDFTMIPTPCTTNPLGTKGCGEAGAIGAPAAAINAIENALAGLGVRTGDIAMPATPQRLWAAIRRARAA